MGLLQMDFPASFVPFWIKRLGVQSKGVKPRWVGSADQWDVRCSIAHTNLNCAVRHYCFVLPASLLSWQSLIPLCIHSVTLWWGECPTDLMQHVCFKGFLVSFWKVLFTFCSPAGQRGLWEGGWSHRDSSHHLGGEDERLQVRPVGTHQGGTCWGLQLCKLHVEMCVCDLPCDDSATAYVKTF